MFLKNICAVSDGSETVWFIAVTSFSHLISVCVFVCVSVLLTCSLIMCFYSVCAVASDWSWCRQLANTPPSIQQRGGVQTGKAHLPAAPAKWVLLGIDDDGGGTRNTLTSNTGHLPHQVTSHSQRCSFVLLWNAPQTHKVTLMLLVVQRQRSAGRLLHSELPERWRPDQHSRPADQPALQPVRQPQDFSLTLRSAHVLQRLFL